MAEEIREATCELRGVLAEIRAARLELSAARPRAVPAGAGTTIVGGGALPRQTLRGAAHVTEVAAHARRVERHAVESDSENSY